MPDRAALALRYDGRVHLLDQTLLPDRERWFDASEPDAMIEAVRALRVRGAPLIGVAAALCLGARARAGATPAELRADAARLRAARPTAVNLMAAVDRVLAALDADGDVEATALALFDEDVVLCDRMAEAGAALVEDGEGLVTHCNTGALATAGVGTALGVVARAHAQGKRVHVWVDETRPLLQGGRLTAWELGRLGVPHTLVTDSMAALVLRDRRAARVLVGADRVARNGDFANKVGTYGLAVHARFHGAAFHVVAPSTTFDPHCPDGAGIPVEERDPAEVRGVAGDFGAVRWAPADAPVWNPAFDVTPATLVTSWVCERGVLSAPAAWLTDWRRPCP